jgi:type I restriction enzyme M protein
MPSGVFKPYAGVSTAVLFFTRGATTERIWFYDMEHDGLSLDDKRTPVAENDIPDILRCWDNRFKPKFNAQRDERLKEINTAIAPLKTERLRLQKEINRLTFEVTLTPNPSPYMGEGNDMPPSPLSGRRAGDEGRSQGEGGVAAELAAMQQQIDQLHDQIAPLQTEINQLTRQFWVTKDQVRANKYDLSASRYRLIEQDEEFYEAPQVTIERLVKLEEVMAIEAKAINDSLK